MDNYYIENVKKIHHWNKNLFSITCSRNKNFKFKCGEFVLLGLKDKENTFKYRAYSVVSSNYEENLEFLSIKIENGIFTKELVKLNVNDSIYISKKPTGTLIKENLLLGATRLWLISAGTGISPFLSIIKDLKIFENFKKIFLIHSVNYKTDLCYKFYITNIFFKMFFFFKKKHFSYCSLITKEKFLKNNNKRITFLLKDEKLFLKTYNIKSFNNLEDRIMVCGGPAMIKDIIFIIENKYKFRMSKNNILGSYAIEKAFSI